MNQRTDDDAPDHDGGETALRRQIADYLTKQFIWDRVSELPVDECLSEADHILALIAAHPAPSTGNEGHVTLDENTDVLALINGLERTVREADNRAEGFRKRFRAMEAEIAALRSANKGGMAESYKKFLAADAVSRQAAKNDGGADYKAKAHETVAQFDDGVKRYSAAQYDKVVGIITASLAQSAADERKRCVAICDEKNAAMEAGNTYQHGYWDACNEIKAAIAAAGHKQGSGK